MILFMIVQSNLDKWDTMRRVPTVPLTEVSQRGPLIDVQDNHFNCRGVPLIEALFSFITECFR